MSPSRVIPEKPVGYRWRSSRLFIVTVISVAMFSDTFLFSFIIPILPDILEHRIQQDSSRTQFFTSVILSMNALVSIAIAPVTGHLADRSCSKNGLMLLSWAMNAVGTAITAWSTSLIGLILGRLIQTFAGSLIWIVGMAILGDTVGQRHLAKALGFTMLFTSAGLLCGPAVSGSLYELVSYSTTWASAFGIVLLGIILQVLIIGPFNEKRHLDEESLHPQQVIEQENETSTLLPGDAPPQAITYQSIADLQEQEHLSGSKLSESSPATTHNVYLMMLRKKSITTALIADALFAMVIASFETTIPIHIKRVFHWESLQAGLLFLLLQVPSMALVVPAGWIKDNIGMRYPVTVGFLLLAPSLWLLGVPGNESFPWASKIETSRIIYLATILSIGVWRTFLLGFGAVEVMNGAIELSAQFPGIFGPNGGFSRSFSMSNISWKLGMFLGPLISGVLTDSVGYYYMNLFFALLCLIMGLCTFWVLRER